MKLLDTRFTANFAFKAREAAVQVRKLRTQKGAKVSDSSIINQKRFTVNLLAIVMQYLNWSEDIYVRQVNRKFKAAFGQNLSRLVNFIQRDIYS